MTVCSARQRGAALLAVLLLVATLSFVVLGATERVAAAASRAGLSAARSEAMRRAIGAEALAAAALAEALRSANGRIGPDAPWLDRPLDAPMEGGAARIVLRDATRCFNVNSLAGTGARPSNAEAFIAMLVAAGAPETGACDLAAAIADWTDADAQTRAGGAEDALYAALPAPYRTGGTYFAEVSELRAVAGMSADLYRRLRPFVCARGEAAPAEVNVNLLRPFDAPLVVALADGRISLAEATDVIAARPPGGYASTEDFWAHPALAVFEFSEETKARARLTSRFFEARIEITYAAARLDAVLAFEADEEGRVALLSRRWGADG